MHLAYPYTSTCTMMRATGMSSVSSNAHISYIVKCGGKVACIEEAPFDQSVGKKLDETQHRRMPPLHKVLDIFSRAFRYHAHILRPGLRVREEHNDIERRVIRYGVVSQMCSRADVVMEVVCFPFA